MTWWKATSVTVTNGGTVVSVNTGDDIQIAQEAGGLVIGSNPPVEIKRTYLDGSSNKKIELRYPWPYANQTAQPALAFPTDGDLAAATAVLKNLIDGFTIATEAEAGVGTDNTKSMTPLRTKQAIDTQRPVQSSYIDATIGRLLQVGAFGLGTTAVDLSTANAFNTITGSGFYRCTAPNSASVGAPLASTSFSLIHNQFGGGVFYATQIAMSHGSSNSRTFTRNNNNGTWLPWVELWHSGTLVKTESASDTTPGRVLQVGDFGIGGATTSTATDANEIIVPGIWGSAGVVLANSPTNFGSRAVYSFFGTTTYGVQMCWDTGDTVNRQMSFRLIRGGTWSPWVEVWHSGNLVKTVNNSDTTAGRMLRVGDFGLGDAGIDVPGNDCNNALVPGFYRLITATTNAWPGKGSGDSMVVTSYGTTAVTQIGVSRGSGTIHVRSSTNGTFGPWVQSWNSDTLVKTSSSTDMTSGRMLKVGDFSIGADPMLAPNVDLNLISVPGNFITETSGVLNLPVGWLQGRYFLQVTGLGTSSYSHQKLINVSAAGTSGLNVCAVAERRMRNAGVWSDWFVSWTSNNLVKTTSNVDATVGSMLKVGDFGIGAPAGSTPVIADMSAAPASTMVGYSSNTATNQPDGATDHFVSLAMRNDPTVAGGLEIGVLSSGGTAIAPKAYVYSGGGSFSKQRLRLYGDTNILGAVSQSAGVPTGAVIQRGTNANGEFVRYADGTMICWGNKNIASSITAAFEGGFKSGAFTQSFPSAFVDQNYRMSLTPSSRTNNAPFALSHAVSGSSASFNFLLHAITSQTSKTYCFDWVATGRWF